MSQLSIAAFCIVAFVLVSAVPDLGVQQPAYTISGGDIIGVIIILLVPLYVGYWIGYKDKKSGK